MKTFRKKSLFPAKLRYRETCKLFKRVLKFKRSSVTLKYNLQKSPENMNSLCILWFMAKQLK